MVACRVSEEERSLENAYKPLLETADSPTLFRFRSLIWRYQACPSARRKDHYEEDHLDYYQEVQGERDDWMFGRVWKTVKAYCRSPSVGRS